MEIKNKVVVVTGATSGIGQACALIFGKAGAKIWITGRSRVKLDETLLLLQKEGVECGGGVCDAAKAEDNEKMAHEVIGHYGRIDILINNAGISMRALFKDLDLKVFHQVMDIFGVPYMLPNTAWMKFLKIRVPLLAFPPSMVLGEPLRELLIQPVNMR